ncbi:MAG: three-Cys-motif partner protein TcmP [Oscillospiraceae bacterium]|jgi:three-Cys-motif partner protein|nr:three-Cys-motif partner protein TcmP [Oscillospiraceae bacterium]
MENTEQQSFGGKWTIEKLNILSNYLDFYLNALKNQKFNKVYIDAFAGSGNINIQSSDEEISGSIRLSLQTTNKFDKYIFIEKNPKHVKELERIIDNEYANLKDRISIRSGDCNEILLEICDMKENTKYWKENRAVLFLDPYATEVKWTTLVAIAKTQAIDIWYLFPFGAAQRLLPNEGIVESWRNKLNDLFGDTAWESRFYKPNPQLSMFSDDDCMIKDVNTKELAIYICERLKSIFPYVADNPKFLYNTKMSPLFLFCFAVANPNPSAIALAKKVAEEHILRKW